MWLTKKRKPLKVASLRMKVPRRQQRRQRRPERASLRWQRARVDRRGRRACASPWRVASSPVKTAPWCNDGRPADNAAASGSLLPRMIPIKAMVRYLRPRLCLRQLRPPSRTRRLEGLSRLRRVSHRRHTPPRLRLPELSLGRIIQAKITIEEMIERTKKQIRWILEGTVTSHIKIESEKENRRDSVSSGHEVLER